MSDDTQNSEATENAETEGTADKNKRQMSFTILDNGVIRADFGPDLDPLELNPALVPETITAAAVAEGLISRARGYASKLAKETRTPENLRAQVAKGFENLMAGVWKVERAEGVGGEFSIEVEAAYRFKVKRAESKGETFEGTLADVAEQFAQLTEEQKTTLKALPRYQACYAEVKAERAAEKAKKLADKADASEEDAPF